MKVTEYLDNIPIELLSTSNGRKLVTRDDPMLFAIVYLIDHLKFEQDEPSLSEFHVALAEYGKSWITEDASKDCFKEVSTSAAAHKIATAGPATYDKISQTFGKVEQGGFFSDSDVIVIAHTSLKESLRGLVDGNGRPLFIEQVSATQPATLFGYALQFSDGAKTSATNQQNPSGNPLLVVGNRQHLILGVRSGPESLISHDAGFATDEPQLKMRARRAFTVGRAKAFGILEVTTT